MDRKYYDNETSPAVINAIEAAKEGVIHRISESCGGHNLLDESDVPTDLRWSYYNSVFFAFTAVTTIGRSLSQPLVVALQMHDARDMVLFNFPWYEQLFALAIKILLTCVAPLKRTINLQ